jgi:hypothetical protein
MFKASRILTLLSLSLAGCTTGPDHPFAYEGVALSLDVRVADPPAAPLPHLGLRLDVIHYCRPGQLDQSSTPDPEATFWGEGQPFVAGASSQRMVVPSSRFAYNQACATGVPPLRFFRPGIEFNDSSTTAPGTWSTPGRDLVYTAAPATLMPFGPDGPALAFPAGYSLLHVSCGSAGAPLQMAVESTQQVLEFHRRKDQPFDGVSRIEQDERLRLEGCGVHLPAVDLGTRVDLDAPTKIAWSVDGTRLLYFVSRGPEPATDHSLRTVPAVGGAPVELSVGLTEDLSLPTNGEVYVADVTGVTRHGHLGPDGSAVFQAVLLERPLGVSPDGQWMAFQQSPDLALAVWNTADGSTRAVGTGVFAGWSPDSHHLAFWPTSATGGGQRIWHLDSGTSTPVGPADRFVRWLPDGRLVLATATGTGADFTVVRTDGGVADRFHFSSLLGEYVWASDRLVGLTQRPWTVVSGWISGHAGLVLEDPLMPAPRSVVATDSVVLAHPTNIEAGEKYPPLDGGVLVWARRCLGAYDAACVFELHRVTLPAGTDQVVATSVEPPAPTVAVAPGGQRVAIGTRSGIFVKILPPL